MVKEVPDPIAEPGEVVVKVSAKNIEAVGKSATTDVIEASAKAYLQAINKIIYKNVSRE